MKTVPHHLTEAIENIVAEDTLSDDIVLRTLEKRELIERARSSYAESMIDKLDGVGQRLVDLLDDHDREDIVRRSVLLDDASEHRQNEWWIRAYQKL